MDIISVKHGLAKAVWQPRNAEEAKLVINFKEDHNTVRVKGVEYFIQSGKYKRNQYGVLEKVEGREGVIELIPEEQREENKTDQQRAEEAKLIINFGEKKEEVMDKGVEWYIKAGKYIRNQYGVLCKNVSDMLTTKDVDVTPVPSVDVIAETVGDVSNETSGTPVVNLSELSLEELQAIYVDVTGKNLSPVYKNNKEWILSKLQKKE